MKIIKSCITNLFQIKIKVKENFFISYHEGDSLAMFCIQKERKIEDRKGQNNA